MEQPQLNSTLSPDSIDTEKLSAVVKKNLTWIIALFVLSNLGAYLVVRYTKPLYESVSELKLDIKRDARDLGIQEFVDDQNANVVAGEIEQIKSKIFLNRIIDSLPLGISYFSMGKVLREEIYRQAPIRVRVETMHARYFDRPINIDLLDGNDFRLRFEDEGTPVAGTFGTPLTHNGLVLHVEKSPFFVTNDPNDYYFVINHRNSLINYLSANLSVEPLSLTANTIKVSFRDFNLFKANDIVNKIDSIYIYYSNEQKNLANKQKIEWLNNELLQVEQKMEGFENYFENFTIQNRSNNLDQDLKRTIELINKIDSQRFELTNRINRLDGIIDDLTQTSSGLSLRSYTFLPDFLNRKLEELHLVIQQRERLALSYNENTFALQQRERELNQLREQVFTQLNELKKTWMLSLANLGKQKDTLEQKFASLPDKNTQFSKNQRFYKLYEEFYLAMMQSKAEFEIAQAGSTPDFKILSSATLPTQPISPKKYLIFGIGIVAGIVLNFFFIGLMYVLTNRITGINEIERSIAIPVLGTIPFSGQTIRKLYVQEHPKSMVSESVRTLRTNLDFFTSGQSRKSVAISSTISGEGKSFLAMNLSAVLAMSKKKVALLDLDMRKTKEEGIFQVPDNTKGMSTILIHQHRWRDCLIPTEIENLDFIPAGPHPPNPSELLINGEFSGLLEELKQEYDFVVMDTPPVGLVTDGMTAMKKADVAIFVVRANYSKHEFLRNLKRLAGIHKLTNLAIVLNAVSASKKGYGYGYYEDESLPAKGWKKLIKR